jgi:hypothetical protein
MEVLTQNGVANRSNWFTGKLEFWIVHRDAGMLDHTLLLNPHAYVLPQNSLAILETDPARLR